MNLKFSSNPITVKESDVIVGLIELDFDLENKNFILEITDYKNNILFKDIVNEDTFITLDISSKTIKLIYLDALSEDILGESFIDLYERFNISIAGGLDFEKKTIDEANLYKQILLQVKVDMDTPKGTPKEVEYHTMMLNKSTMNENARKYVETKIRQVISKNEGLSESKINEFTLRIYSDFYGMGILQEIDDDPTVGEIMVNGYIFPKFRCDIYYIRGGEKIKYNKTFNSLDELTNVYSRAIAFSRKELNNLENALVEATRANRDRVNIIIPDASESYVLNIRKFGNFVPNLNSMREYGTINDFIDTLMAVVVKGKANIGIGGEMGTGKTTFVNFLLSYTPPMERKVVIASVSETDVERVLKGHDVVILNVDDTKGFSFERLVRASLRTTASRVIIPESRGSEFRQVYEANLKTKGNMFTAHALSDYQFLDMCVDMYNGDNTAVDVVNVRNKIAKAVDVIIIMRRVGNSIRIDSISEVVLDKNQNFERMNLLYFWDSDPEDNTKGEYLRTENRLTIETKKRLNKYGVPMSEMANL